LTLSKLLLKRFDYLGICNQCKGENTGFFWCQTCNSSHFKREFDNWKSGNVNVDTFIKDAQLEATSSEKVIEWIPYSKFRSFDKIGEGGFGEVYSAEWEEGNIIYWNTKNSQWKRTGLKKVALKYLKDSQNISNDILNEVIN
jgi:serine/threonine protein kinase